MKKFFRSLELNFERFTNSVTVFLGSPLTFFVAMCLVLFWLTNREFYDHNLHEQIGDILLAITFISLFIIQKTSNRFAAALHLKLNELISSHETANNAVINLETKTEHEINELLKEYHENAEEAFEALEEKIEKIEEKGGS